MSKLVRTELVIGQLNIEDAMSSYFFSHRSHGLIIKSNTSFSHRASREVREGLC